MKNIMKYISIFFAACIAMTACLKEDMPVVDSDSLVKFTATYENPATKTVLDGLTPVWTANDTISIYDGENNKFSNALTANSKTAEFKGELKGQGIDRGGFIAASPYNPDYKFAFVGSYVGGMQVYAQQTAVENGYDPKSAPAAAFSDTTQLSFYNAYSLVKFTIASEGVTEVTLAGKQNETIAGKMNVAKAEPLKMTVTAAETKVTLKGSFKKGSTYYMAVIPVAFQSGFTMTLKSSAGETVESLNYIRKYEIKRSTILNVGELSLTPATDLPDDGGNDNGNEDGGNDDGGNDDSGDDNGNNDGGNTGDKPAESATIYMRPNSNWKIADARFAVYFFGDSDTWVDMTDADGDGNYECKIPEGGYTNLIFIRMNPAHTDNRWNTETDDETTKHVWNQSPDLDIPTGAAICYVLNEGQWEGEGLGYWTTYPPVITEPTPDPTPDPTPGENEKVIYLNTGGNSLWDQDGAWFEVWSWASGQEGSWYTMTSVGSGVYSCTIPNEKDNIIFVRRGPDMSQGWDQDVHYWNKTDDLAIPSGMNCYTITGWGGSEGTWSAR